MDKDMVEDKGKAVDNIVDMVDMELDYKMSFLKGILAKIGEDSVGVIDMTKTNPTYSSF